MRKLTRTEYMGIPGVSNHDGDCSDSSTGAALILNWQHGWPGGSHLFGRHDTALGGTD